MRRTVVAILTLALMALAVQGCSERRYDRDGRVRVVQTERTVVEPARVAVQQPVAPASAQVPAPAPQVQVETTTIRPTVIQEPATRVEVIEPARPEVVVRRTEIPQTEENIPGVRFEATGAGVGPSSLDSNKPFIDVDVIPDNVPQKLEQYRVGPGDRLQIKVFGQDDISGEFEISAAGELSVPLIGQITAENLTLGELQEVLTQAFDADFIVDPKVSIEVTNYRPFFILGQVGKPGSYKYQPGLNTRMAIALGGGYTRRAREEPITVYRVNASGELVRFRVDQNAIILPGDTIEVHRRLF